MAKLIIHRDGNPEREVVVEPTTTIGRLRDCTVQLEDPQISRVHAVLAEGPDGLSLTDQGSMNGTLVNGERLGKGETVQLVDGDRVEIATFELRLAADVEAPAAPRPKDRPSADALSELERPPEASVLLSHLVDSRESVPVWSKGEIELEVVDIINETGDAKTFRLRSPSHTLFAYKPGQFVTITLDVDGQQVKRSYSISSSPSRPHTLELTIKRVPGGLISNFMADRIALGDRIPVRGPAGKFSCFNYPSRKMLCIAGGSGVTPIMSMMRWIVDTAADVDVVLLLSGHTPSDFIFRKELETISARHSNLRVLFTVTSGWNGSESWTGLAGRISDRMIQLVAPDLLERHVFMCGPKPFSEAMKAHLKALDFPTANLHTESFGEGRVAQGTPVPPEAPARAARKKATKKATKKAAGKKAAPGADAGAATAAPSSAPAEADSGFKVRFVTSGVDALAPGDQPLLEVAEAHGVEIDYACRAGSCGSCRTRCVSGSVEMDECDLDDDERKDGWVYPCVARATSDVELEV